MNFESVIIYGAGEIGKRTLQFLGDLKIENRVKYFVKSEKEFKPYFINGIEVKPVYEVQDFYKNTIFLLAVSDKYATEIREIVKNLKIKNYMDARKLYAESYKKSELALKMRKLRNVIYKNLEKKTHSKNRKEIYATHITYCVAQNAGDTYLSWCVRKYLAFHKWNIIDIREKVTLDLINQINQTDVLVIGGGGLFLPDTNKNKISGWQWAISEELLEKIHIPIIIYSVGYNYFIGQKNTELFIHSLNAITRKAIFIGLRNYGSIEAVKGLLNEDLRDKICYQPCTTVLAKQFVPTEKCFKTKKKRIIAVNMAFDRSESRFGLCKENILTSVAKAISEISKKGFHIVYVAHCDADLQFLLYLDREQVKYKVKNFTQCLPKQIYSFYQKTECTIGMRGHAQMIPYGLGRKIITLGTHNKMKWFLEDVNMEECYVNLRENTNEICSNILEVFAKIIDSADIEWKQKEMSKKLLEISEKNRLDIYKAIHAE